MNQQNQLFAQTTHCPKCGRCFCGTAKLQAIDGIAICGNCKPMYEAQLRAAKEQQVVHFPKRP